LGGAFREEEDDNEDNGDEQGQQARRRRHDAVDVRDALRGQAVIVVVHDSPEAPIAGGDHLRGQAGWIRRGRNDHGRVEDSGDDGTGDALVMTTTTNGYHTFNDKTTRITIYSNI
jgi:hypothetical protein